MVYRYVTAEVEVDLSDFDTDDLREELENRGESIGLDYSSQSLELLTAIWERRRLGQDYQTELDQLIYNVLGKIV
jgi:CubicO group peptidase (beta-lactamase class C family)